MKILVLAILPAEHNPARTKAEPPRLEDSPLYEQWVKDLHDEPDPMSGAAIHCDTLPFGNRLWFDSALEAARPEEATTITKPFPDTPPELKEQFPARHGDPI
jgi:hypothetical protein